MTQYKEDCRECPRLAKFLDQVKLDQPNYFCKPVPPFGDKSIRLLIVGLAPGMHGANRTGRPFTGDYAGILLYKALFYFGFSNQQESTALDDSLKLIGCRITNAVKCLPPQNKPQPEEIRQCNQYLKAELTSLKPHTLILALGSIAHQSILSAFELKKTDYMFAHGARHVLSNHLVLYDSYHCSRYNTQTKRLTEEKFFSIFHTIKKEMES
jgi:uracil-DNA glycosylase family 4